MILMANNGNNMINNVLIMIMCNVNDNMINNDSNINDEKWQWKQYSNINEIMIILTVCNVILLIIIWRNNEIVILIVIMCVILILMINNNINDINMWKW